MRSGAFWGSFRRRPSPRALALDDVAEAVDADAYLLEPRHGTFDRSRRAVELADDPALVGLDARPANVRLDVEAADELSHDRLADKLLGKA